MAEVPQTGMLVRGALQGSSGICTKRNLYKQSLMTEAR
jgi:hypothetical protein